MTAKKTPEELEIAFSAESRQRKLIHQLEVKKWGIEQTAETAAEMGDTEAYIGYCREVTKLQLQREVLERKQKVELAAMPDMYGRRVDTLLQQ